MPNYYMDWLYKNTLISKNISQIQVEFLPVHMVHKNMNAKVALELCLALISLVDALPIDGNSYHVPDITYASPAVTSYLSHAPVAVYPSYAHAAPALYAAPAPTILTHAAPAIVKTAPAVAVAKVAIAEPFDPNPQYNFAYGVTDHATGDSKSQQETLVNGVVHGSYSLTEPDGSIRKVTYTADKINGFNAVVEKKGAVLIKKTALAVPAIPAVHAIPAIPAVAKVAYAAPAYAYDHH